MLQESVKCQLDGLRKQLSQLKTNNTTEIAMTKQYFEKKMSELAELMQSANNTARVGDDTQQLANMWQGFDQLNSTMSQNQGTLNLFN
jgi:septation ring formation regulator EzrA